MFQYVAIALLATAGVLLVINTLKGLIRGLRKTVGTLASVVLSIIVALIATAIVCKPTSVVVTSSAAFLKDALVEGEIAELFAIPELVEALTYYAVMIIAPIFFTLVFVLASVVISIIVAIVLKIVKPSKKPGALLNRLGGAGVGLVCGFLIAIVTLMPVVGMIDLVMPAAELSMVQDEGMEDVAEILNDANESSAIKLLSNLGCKTLYNGLASATFEGEKIYLKDDVKVIFSVVDNFDALAVEMAEYGDDQIAAIDNIVVELDSSEMLKNAVAGVLSTAAEKWAAGESFVGMEKPEVGDMAAPLVDTALDVLANSTKDTIGEDLMTVSDIFSIMIKSDLLGGGETSDLIAKFNENGTISELIVAVGSNPRMAPLADQVTVMGVKVLADSLGIPENAQDRYDRLMNSVAADLSATYGMSDDERSEALSEKLTASFVKYGVDIDENGVANITAAMLHDLGALSTVEAGDVEEFFIMYAVATGETLSSGAKNYDLLANDKKKVEVNGDGTISIDGKKMKNYNASNYKQSQAYTMGATGADIGKAATLSSPETMESTLITAEDITSSIGSFGDCSDIAAEAAKVEEIITAAATMLENIDPDSASVTDLMPVMGEVLDLISESEIFGQELSANMITAIMQSDMVTGSLGMSVAETTKFANSINNAVSSDESAQTYVEATDVIIKTMEIISTTTNSEATDEEKAAAAEQLIDSVNTSNADMLMAMITPSLLESYGIPKEYSGKTSNMLKKLIDNLAKFDTSTADDNAVADEAAAVNAVVGIAMGGINNSSTLFNGVISMSADRLVDLVLSSQVISGTLDDYGNVNNPFGVTLPESDVEELTSAIQSAYAASGRDKKVANTLECLAAMLGVDITLN